MTAITLEGDSGHSPGCIKEQRVFLSQIGRNSRILHYDSLLISESTHAVESFFARCGSHRHQFVSKLFYSDPLVEKKPRLKRNSEPTA
jgi:hypothetical protein